MITVFLDESGDLGFDLTKSSTSRHFLVTALVCSDPKPVDKAVRRIFAGFSKAEVKHHHGYLHAFSERPETRRRLLGLLAELDIGVFVVKLDKRRVFTDLAAEPHVLYMSLVNILMNRLLDGDWLDARESLRLVASQRETRGLLNRGFAGYLVEHIMTPPGMALTVDVRHTSAERGLQAADLMSWAFFRLYEHGDSSYANVISERILEVVDIFG